MRCMLLVLCVVLSGLGVSFAEPAAGLRLEIRSADGKSKDTFTSPRAALRVLKGSAPSVMLKPGAFQATWSGALRLESRSRLYFKFVGKGEASLIVNGEVAVEAKGEDLSGVESSRLRLNPGDVPIEVRYTSPTDGDGQVRLFWKGREFAWEPVPDTVLVHSANDLQKAGDLLRHGRQVFTEQQCIKCHMDDSVDVSKGMPELEATGPSLLEMGDRLNPDWVAHWVQNPSAMRPQARMPALLPAKDVASAVAAKDSSAWDIAAYLESLSGDAPAKALPDASLVKAGGDLFAEFGCASCHQRPGSTGDDSHGRIPLRYVSWKFKDGALGAFLKDPAKHYAWGRMPDFQLSEKEADSLAAFLRHDASAVKAPDAKLKGDAVRGKTLIAELGCVNCHALPADFKPVKRAALLAQDLSDARCVSIQPGKAPRLNISESDKTAVREFVSKAYASLNQVNLAEFAERQILDLNCTACHDRGNQGAVWDAVAGEVGPLKLPLKEGEHEVAQDRPSLTWVGDKLHAEWMTKLFAGTVDGKPRPWLHARMPVFKSRAEALANGLALAYGVTPSGAPEFTADAKLSDIGKKLTGNDGGFSCILCHNVGKGKAIAVFEVEGLNLDLSRERLRHDYYLRWMLKPSRLEPSTKMPAFAGSDGTTGFVDILGGDGAKQFDAIWHYLQAGRGVVPPKGMK